MELNLRFSDYKSSALPLSYTATRVWSKKYLTYIQNISPVNIEKRQDRRKFLCLVTSVPVGYQPKHAITYLNIDATILELQKILKNADKTGFQNFRLPL